MSINRPVWAEVDLNKIRHNYREVRRLVGPGIKVMAMVKGNAYGHGVVGVAQALSEEGTDTFGVAIMNEAIQLREAGIKKQILIAGWTPPSDFDSALKHDVTLTVFSYEEAQLLSDRALKTGKKARVHLKIDTGMGRLGIQPDAFGYEEVDKILKLPGLYVEGIFTHLSKADEKDKSYTQNQLGKFQEFISAIEGKTGYSFRIRHAANSAAIIDHPEAYFDLVRPGIILYGLKPSDEVNLAKIDLRQAISLKATVSLVKEVQSGSAISYGGKFITKEPSIIATLPLGYADGYTRLLSGKAEVLCNGERAPIVGKICMDQLMFNATYLKTKVKPGDVVTLIGHDNGGFISADEIADHIGTIVYEVVLMLSARVPRIYT